MVPLDLRRLKGEELVVLAAAIAAFLAKNQDDQTVKTLINLLEAVEDNLEKILIQRNINRGAGFSTGVLVEELLEQNQTTGT